MNNNDFDVYVIDLETTGLEGYPKDHIVEIGIAVANIMDKTVKPIYNAIINVPNIREIDKKENCWVFSHTDLTVDMVENSTSDFDTVVEKVREIVKGKRITAYYQPFDFDKFLFHSPWQLNEIAVQVADIKDLAKDYLTYYYKTKEMEDFKGLVTKSLIKHCIDNNTLHAEQAYMIYCPKDPAKLKFKQTHRAMDDAVMEGHILIKAVLGEMDRALTPVIESTYQSIIQGELCHE